MGDGAVGPPPPHAALDLHFLRGELQLVAYGREALVTVGFYELLQCFQRLSGINQLLRQEDTVLKALSLAADIQGRTGIHKDRISFRSF